MLYIDSIQNNEKNSTKTNKQKMFIINSTNVVSLDSIQNKKKNFKNKKKKSIINSGQDILKFY